ncbi:DNA-binding transcriptional regulator, LysR family [Cribrihabitans marinus]|uniref:DNA-binding transcriptional regulator, LysR family n=1 Tax=Cribrihabitans marinus TaxID=1227549 RepID=A0A1H6VRH7_9RHOB|nr:LysR family transcriptional regulator [Cribrihabitans marinus]GGH25417.1 LysR family transcriptional regulator [Cribrihabitans marinus]SEJ06316.1 DNA-binding transcriptional regulator, LysR family [Cribrihabitans marinus]
MHRLNWDDLQFVLAVVEAQSVAGAARRLGVNHATVLRRVAGFEEQIGTQLFDRGPQGYTVRPDRLRLIAAAQEVAQAVTSVEQLARGIDTPLSGTVRVTSTDTICQCLMPVILSDLRRRSPQLHLSMISTNLHLNLARLEAEITVRPATVLPEGLVGESPVAMRFGVYAAPGHADAGWLGMDGPMRRSRAWAWLERQIGPGGCAASADSFLVLRELAAVGAGKALLPCFVARGDPRLQRLPADLPDDLATPVWVACHEDLANVPRLNRLRRLLCDALAENAALLAAEDGA